MKLVSTLSSALERAIGSALSGILGSLGATKPKGIPILAAVYAYLQGRDERGRFTSEKTPEVIGYRFGLAGPIIEQKDGNGEDIRYRQVLITSLLGPQLFLFPERDLFEITDTDHRSWNPLDSAIKDGTLLTVKQLSSC